MSPDSIAPPALTLTRVFRLWLPLAASWVLMGAELPTFTAFVARMPDPTIHLAAYAGVTFAISLVIEGPVIMLLAASTALCVDWNSYRRVRAYMYWLAGVFTAVHVLVAFTPLYDFVARVLLDADPRIIEPGRVGLRIMTPWTGMIAYRRFHQGVLIRFGQSRRIALGTALRLAALSAVLAAGALWQPASGIVVGSSAVAIAVTVEACYVGLVVRPLLEGPLRAAPPRGPAIDLRGFLRFYLPLAVTPLLAMLLQPLGSGAMSRMPDPLLSLAAWPAVHGLVFLTRSTGFAYNEVVIALLGEPQAERVLRRFALLLAAAMMALLLLLAATPLSAVWFEAVSGLPGEMVDLCSSALLLALLMPGCQALQSWHQGQLVYHRRTRAITESVAIYLALAFAGLAAGVWWQQSRGIYWVLGVFSAGSVLQTFYLADRARRNRA